MNDADCLTCSHLTVTVRISLWQRLRLCVLGWVGFRLHLHIEADAVGSVVLCAKEAATIAVVARPLSAWRGPSCPVTPGTLERRDH